MNEIMLDPRGAELYADDHGKPCLRLVEAIGRLVDHQRVGGRGAYIERWDGERWQYLDGPFFAPLHARFSDQALQAFDRYRNQPESP
jgi:hypothetical protein